ncbi:MAG: C40 family peptidase [Bacteroidota bacterium]|nr:C40 family peptidase [Bacteroidota bacterium]
MLREYLPEIADIHETKVKGKGFSYISVPVTFDSRSPFADPFLRYDLLRNIDKWLGTRYRYGGSTSRGVDCSGFTSAVMSATLRTTFAGSSHVQAARFTPIFSVDSLQFGDMVFFSGRNRKSNRIGHVGVYLGNGVFAHSSTGRGVIYSHISEGYYTERFRWGGRFIAGRQNHIQTANVFSN